MNKKMILKKLKELKKLFYKKFFGTTKVATVRRRNTMTVVTRSIKIGDKIITSEPEFHFDFNHKLNKSLGDYNIGAIDINEVDVVFTMDDKPMTMININ